MDRADTAIYRSKINGISIANIYEAARNSDALKLEY
jgi:hypothetical protein